MIWQVEITSDFGDMVAQTFTDIYTSSKQSAIKKAIAESKKEGLTGQRNIVARKSSDKETIF